jgi:RNA polymerase sigma factor (sigma-70 family)
MDDLSKSMFHTDSRMLNDLHQGGGDAVWARFVAKYTPLIHRYCCAHRLQETDTEDLTQAVFIRLLRVFERFEYDRQTGKFRDFLRQTTRFVIQDFWRRRSRRPPAVGGEESSNGCGERASNEDFVDELVEKMLYAQAESRVFADAIPWHCEAYQLSQQGKAAEETAILLKQEIGTVKIAVWRIARKIQSALNDLNES